MEAILDFNVDLDIPLLERVVQVFFTGSGAEQQQAQQVLTSFQEHSDSWQRVPAILEQARDQQTKYVALQILEKLINVRWKVLPEDQRSGIRNFIVNVIINISSDEASLRREKSYVNKLNLILVQILKQEWPHNWPTFISEIVSSSKSNLTLCENNMVILKLMSEEIFDYSSEQMTTSKARALKNQMCQEFSEVFQLCHEVLQKATKPSLIKATLETLLRFLAWIPIGYIFETDIIDSLVERYLEVASFRNVTLKCLSEIAALKLGTEYDSRFVILFSMVMTKINAILPPGTNIAGAYADSSDADQELVLNLAIFLTNFLANHLSVIENPEGRDVLLNAHLYLVKISQVDEREIFRLCLEYWSKLVSELYDEVQSQPVSDSAPYGGFGGSGFGGGNGGGGLNSNGNNGSSNRPPLRKDLYAEILSNLRLVMIERMAKPEEVLIVENEEGEIVREFLKEIDTIVLYKSMREVLVYLTHLDVVDTENIMTEKLAKQIDGTEWSWNNLNTLCWAIGSISGTMTEESEKRFLVTVIKDLLGLTEAKRGKDNKAVVASNIMYIVGQYPRFLKAHWKFLKTVVNKLFEFMHEYHEGVQDMACDTFIKIAQKCRRQFVMHQASESEPFIDEIIRNLESITSDLSSSQIHVFFEAVGYMVSAQPNKPAQERLINNLMEMPNTAWDRIMNEAQSSVDVFANPDTIKLISNILKTNVAACSSIGTFFMPQIARIYVDMLSLYKAVSTIISETTATDGLIATKTPKIRGLRTIKKEILKLVETYIKKAEDLEQVNTNFIPPLLEAVLGDYNRNIPQARDAEVLNVMATIVSRLGSLLTDKVPDILAAVFECTLEMINQDFSEFPEHRVGFFRLIYKICINCFSALLVLDPRQFKLLVDSIMWAIKHTMRDVADTGLNICLELITKISEQDPQTASGFYQQYFIPILQDLFYVLTDTDHKSGFKSQVQLLAKLFNLVESGAIQVPIYDPSTVTDPNMTNQKFIREHTVTMLGNAFPHLSQSQATTFVSGLCEHNQDGNKFKTLVRDFLIQLREFGDSADLYAEEREAEAQRKQDRAMAVPGMVKPSEVPQEDEEL